MTLAIKKEEEEEPKINYLKETFLLFLLKQYL
jgi:hypothetical protein